MFLVFYNLDIATFLFIALIILPHPQTHCDAFSADDFWKPLWKKKKLLVFNNSSICHNVFKSIHAFIFRDYGCMWSFEI